MLLLNVEKLVLIVILIRDIAFNCDIIPFYILKYFFLNFCQILKCIIWLHVFILLWDIKMKNFCPLFYCKDADLTIIPYYLIPLLMFVITFPSQARMNEENLRRQEESVKKQEAMRMCKSLWKALSIQFDGPGLRVGKLRENSCFIFNLNYSLFF